MPSKPTRRRPPAKDRWRAARRQRDRDQRRRPLPGQMVFAWFTESAAAGKDGGS